MTNSDPYVEPLAAGSRYVPEGGRVAVDADLARRRGGKRPPPSGEDRDEPVRFARGVSGSGLGRFQDRREGAQPLPGKVAQLGRLPQGLNPFPQVTPLAVARRVGTWVRVVPRCPLRPSGSLYARRR